MPTDSTDASPAQQVSRPVIKFIIGFLAGLCAAFFPRLTAALTVASGTSNVVLFDAGYISLSLIFAVLVGAVVMILEWGVPREPRATFMMAIGVPALITGSLNTTTGVDAVKQQVQENQELVKQLEDFANIPTLPSRNIQPLSMNNGIEGQKQDDLAWLEVVGIKPAYASPSIPQQSNLVQAGITVDEPLFYIVLFETASKQEAQEKVQQLQSSVPGVVAVQSGSQYLVLFSNQAVKRSDAVLITLKLKKQFHLQPSLMQAQ